MKFNDFDKKMRLYEEAHDVCVLPGINIIVRLDGRSFHTFTKDFKKPFDNMFINAMKDIVNHFMTKESLDVIYGYYQSDEISLLLRPGTEIFNRKERKINSVFASIASSILTKELGRICSFDSRVCQIPGVDLIADYFAWRQADCFRNCINSYCFWTLVKKGNNARYAASLLEGKDNAWKNEFLFQNGINVNDLLSSEKRGVNFYFSSYMKKGFNPIKGITELALRKKVDISSPFVSYEENYKFLQEIINMGIHYCI